MMTIFWWLSIFIYIYLYLYVPVFLYPFFKTKFQLKRDLLVLTAGCKTSSKDLPLSGRGDGSGPKFPRLFGAKLGDFLTTMGYSLGISVYQSQNQYQYINIYIYKYSYTIYVSLLISCYILLSSFVKICCLIWFISTCWMDWDGFWTLDLLCSMATSWWPTPCWKLSPWTVRFGDDWLLGGSSHLVRRLYPQL